MPLIILPYNRVNAVNYATTWANGRNDKFFDFSSIGGDCTNFISQCVYQGAPQMNYVKDLGWYYNNASDKAPAWTGVEFFYNFIISNNGLGPFGKEVEIENLIEGDIIQLGNNIKFYHSLIVTGNTNGKLLVSTHSFDTLNRPLSSYYYQKLRGISISGYRIKR